MPHEFNLVEILFQIVTRAILCYHTPMKIKINHGTFMLAVLIFSLAWPAWAGELTAFQLVKEGNRYVGEDIKDQVVQIRSEKSVGGMVPNV
jgi:hypothetical protein